MLLPAPEFRRTCEDFVDLAHHQPGVLLGEAHGGLELEHVPVRAVRTEEDPLVLQSA